MCVIKDNLEFDRNFSRIYSSELPLKKEIISTSKGSFLDLSIINKNKKFKTQFYDKRDACPLPVVRMPYLDSNITSSIYYASMHLFHICLLHSLFLLFIFLLVCFFVCVVITLLLILSHLSLFLYIFHYLCSYGLILFTIKPCTIYLFCIHSFTCPYMYKYVYVSALCCPDGM